MSGGHWEVAGGATAQMAKRMEQDERPPLINPFFEEHLGTLLPGLLGLQPEAARDLHYTVWGKRT